MTRAQLESLYRRRTFGIKLGLDVEEALLAKLDNPERAYAAIHVAGTNGKGSVCAILDSILRMAGFKVGLYTSPHLVRFHERIRVAGRPIDDAELALQIEKVERASAEVEKETGRESTFFECATAIALSHFREKGVQLAILETGMGGRLDATNVVDPILSVITKISLDHTERLGDDIATIAKEKCGIIKTNRPVVCGAMEAAALSVVQRIARERKSPFVLAEETVTVTVASQDLDGQKARVESDRASYGAVKFPLLGLHQAQNLAIAVAAVECVADAIGVDISADVVREGISRVVWPGRCHVLSADPLMILDGAHNPEAAKALAATLKTLLKKRPLGMILGLCDDKDMKGFLKAFRPLPRIIWAVPIQNERSLPVEAIAAVGAQLGCDVRETSTAEALEAAEEWARESRGAVCITGSLFLVGETLAIKEGPCLPPNNGLAVCG